MAEMTMECQASMKITLKQTDTPFFAITFFLCVWKLSPHHHYGIPC